VTLIVFGEPKVSRISHRGSFFRAAFLARKTLRQHFEIGWAEYCFQ
jgi:hypothetical protein